MKKLICLFLCITLLIPMAVSCSKDSAVESNERETRTKRSGKKDKETDEEDKDEFLSSLFEDSIVPEENEEFSETDDRIKVGFIYLHDENSAYDLNFMTAAKTACEEMGVEYVEKTQVPESNACYDAAVELVEVDKCDIIFADSYGHEQFMIMAAKEYPETEFCHASGVMAHTEKLDNYHNAYASIYEGRYLTGVVAGMKLNEMIEEGEITAEWVKMGYVGTFTFAEVISAYTSFYLGAKSVCPSVTMEVMFTGSMYDETKEKEAANALIEGGCVLISQYSESLGAPIACENAGIPNIAYNGSTKDVCPETFLVSSRIDWTPYFKYIIDCVKNGEDIFFDWTGSLLTGSVILSEINTKAAAEGTAEKLEDIKNDLITGNLQVFDTDNFTVGGERLDSFMADVDMDFNYTPDTEVIENGVFYESKYRSAPYFVIEIDGINLLDRNYG